MSQILPPDAERARLYETFAPKAAKTLMADGSIVAAGVQIQPPDSERAALYETYAPSPAKFLMPDGSVTDIGGDGFGVGGTVRWFANVAERDSYYVTNPGQLKDGISVGIGNPVVVFTYDGTNWLPGALAFKGDRGEAPRFRMNGTMLQYRFDTQIPTVWTNLQELTPAPYIHTQNIAAATWVIPHNLNRQFVGVRVITFDGTNILPEIDYTSQNIVTLGFAKPMQGIASITI
jgi:hypothetical protein